MEVTPVSDHGFIMELFFKNREKNRDKLRTICRFTDSCQEKSVNSQELLIYPSVGKFWGFFPLFILSFCQSTKLLAEVVTFSYS